MSRLRNMAGYQWCVLVAIVCPLIAFLVVLVITYSHAEFWQTVLSHTEDDANRTAGAMMGFAEAMQAALVMVVGFCLGIFFSIISLVLQRSRWGIGALLLNLLVPPLLLVI